MSKAIIIVKVTCLQCGHEWAPTVSKPKVCPRCKSYNWQVERPAATAENTK